MNAQITANLRRAYDARAEERNAGTQSSWKLVERAAFLERLRAAGVRRLLEIGGGPGHSSAFFRDAGLDVVMTDLSPEMVRLAHAKGLDARVMDFRQLDFPDASFDAVFALNCLLHVPSADLPRALAEVRRVLQPNGLFYYGVYGGYSFESVFADDAYEPKRYFVFYPDDELRRRAAAAGFDEVSFRAIALEDDDAHFQELILRPAERA